MRTVGLSIPGPLLLVAEPAADVRGSFARTFCRAQLAEQGVAFELVQANVSHNVRRGTLRGMHFQRAPHEEPKIVSALRGKVFDVVVDVREGSPTRLRWASVELVADGLTSLYIPAGFAHGFQTLEDDSVVGYWMGESYHPESAVGLRWNDPALAITWPIGDPVLSPRDAEHPLLDERAAGAR